MDSDKLRNLWSETVGSNADWETLSVDSTYRRPPETSQEPASPALAPPGSYTLGAVLGEGGMGTVYRARQNSLRRDVAIKKLKPARGSAKALSAFLAEAYAHGLLDHPNIVPVYDLGRDEQGGVQLAMKLVAGRSWKARLREGGWRLSEQLEILCQVCNAVAFAHSRGLAHCDLKPANVLLGGFGEVFVVDWGLAVCLDGRDEGSLRSRESIRAPTGTPVYMAPELARGEGLRIGPATDVYLLGACLFELLSGRPPHQGASFFEVVQQAASGKIGQLPQDQPEELVQICRKALAAEPDARYSSALALRDALRGYLEHRESLAITVAARAQLQACTPEQVPARELYERYAAAVAGFRQARALWSGNQAADEGEQQARLAYAQAALRLGDLELADSQCRKAVETDAVAGAPLLARIGEARARRARALSSRRRLRRALLLSVAVFVVGLLIALVVVLRAHATIARRNEQIARSNDALRREKQRAEQERAFAERRGALAENALTRLIETVDARLLSRGSATSRALAAEILPVAIDGFSALRDTDYAHNRADIGTAATHLLLARLQHSLRGDSDAALADLQQAARLLRSQLPDARAQEQLGRVLTERGRLQLTVGTLAAAETDAAEALRLLREPRARADALLLQASLRRARKDPAAARSSLEEGLALVTGDAQDTFQLALGQVLRELGLAEEACARLQACIASMQRQVQAHPEALPRGWELALAHFELGRARQAAGQPGARASLEACLALRRTLSADDPEAAHSLQWLAQVESELARLLLAEGAWERAGTLSAAAVGRQAQLAERDPQNPLAAVQLAAYLDLQASVAARQGLWDDALRGRSLAVDALRRALGLGEDSPRTRALLAQALEQLARVLLLRGLDGEAPLLECLALLEDLRAATPADAGLARTQVHALISLASRATAGEARELLARCASILEPLPGLPADLGYVRLLQAELLLSQDGDEEQLTGYAQEAAALLGQASAEASGPALADRWGRALDILTRSHEAAGARDLALGSAQQAVAVRLAGGVDHDGRAAGLIEAQARWAALLEAAGRDAEAWELRGDALRMCRELLGRFPAASALPPLHVRLTEACAGQALALGLAEQALVIYQEAVDVARARADAQTELGYWLRRCGELHDQAGDAHTALQAFSESAQVLEGVLRSHAGPSEEVEPELVALVELAAARARLLRGAGETAAARAVLEQAVRLLAPHKPRLVYAQQLDAFLARALERQRLAEQGAPAD